MSGRRLDDAECWLKLNDGDYSAFCRSWSKSRDPGTVDLELLERLQTAPRGKVRRGKILGYRSRRAWRDAPAATVWRFTPGRPHEPIYIAAGDETAVLATWRLLAVQAGFDPDLLARQRGDAYAAGAAIVAELSARGARRIDIASALKIDERRVSERITVAGGNQRRDRRGKAPAPSSASFDKPAAGSIYLAASADNQAAVRSAWKAEQQAPRPWWWYGRRMPFADPYNEEGSPRSGVEQRRQFAQSEARRERAALLRTRRRRLGDTAALPRPLTMRCRCRGAADNPVFTRTSLLELPRVLSICSRCGAVNGRKPDISPPTHIGAFSTSDVERKEAA